MIQYGGISVNWINDRKQLSYKVVKDTNCIIELVLMTNLTTRLIRNLPFTSKVKSKRIFVVSTLVFKLWSSNVQPSPAMGLIPAPVVRIQPSYRYSSEVKTVPTVSPRLDKIIMISTNKMSPLIYLNAQQFNDMLLKFNEPKPNFIMTKDEALRIIDKSYPGQLEIRANERISDWQGAKKIYHVSDFGINPEDYGMTKDNILKIQRIGLTNYAREGHPLPPIKLVKAYQMAVKNMCEHFQHSDGRFSSRGEQKVYDVTYSYNIETRHVAAFNKQTGDLITAGKYSRRPFDRFLDTMHLGRL